MTDSTSFTSTSSETIDFKVENPCISSTTALLSSTAGSAAPTPLGRMTASVPYSSVQASSLCDCQHRATPIIMICRYCGFMLVHGVPETGTAFRVRGQELAPGLPNSKRCASWHPYTHNPQSSFASLRLSMRILCNPQRYHMVVFYV